MMDGRVRGGGSVQPAEMALGRALGAPFVSSARVAPGLRASGYYWVRDVRWRPDVRPQIAEWTAGVGWAFCGDFRTVADADVVVHGSRIPDCEGTAP